ncbi:MAG: hypothetical protein V3V33_05500 [Candidatus Lokiarchaeia archaeon]
MSNRNNLIDLCESKSEKKKLNVLLQEYFFDDVSFAITTLLELKNIDILQELFKIQDFQSKLGAGFYKFFPEIIDKDLNLPKLIDFHSILNSAEKLLKRKLEYEDQIQKTGYPLDFNPIKTWDYTKSPKSSMINIKIDIGAIKLLLDLLKDGSSSNELIDRIVNLNSIKNTFIHRKMLGYIPEPLMNQENLKKLLNYIISDNPINKIWYWLNPWNFYNIADYKMNQQNYQDLIDYIEQHLDQILNTIDSRLRCFCPEDYYFSDTFALTFEWGIRGWVTNEMAGCNLEFFKNDLNSLIRTIIHEIYHRIQLNILSTQNRTKEDLSFNSIVKRDLGNLYDNKFYETISYIYLEGSATYVGGSNEKISKTENILNGLNLIKSIYEKLYKEKNIEEADELINSGMISNGPFYSLGNYMTSKIVEVYRRDECYHELLEGTISFFKKYNEAYNKDLLESDIWYGSKIADRILYFDELID